VHSDYRWLLCTSSGVPESWAVFVDRSLGRLKVPELLRAGGVELVTLAEHYGRPKDEKVNDTTWIADASALGWVTFMKDERIRRRPAERAAIHASKAKCFCLANGNLPADEMAKRYQSAVRSTTWIKAHVDDVTLKDLGLCLEEALRGWDLPHGLSYGLAISALVVDHAYFFDADRLHLIQKACHPRYLAICSSDRRQRRPVKKTTSGHLRGCVFGALR